MVTKEQIKATMEVLLETFPKLKDDIIEDRPFDIRKETKGWICFIDTKHSQFGDQPGRIITYFDIEGNPTEMSVSDLGRPQRASISKDENGKYIAESQVL